VDTTACIKIDAKKHYPVEENIFGHFIEHLGFCIKNGIWDERANGIPREFGMVRTDVFEAMKALRPPILRWPGGCFSDTYHWRDGVGPAARRPARINRAWWWIRPPATLFENNHFGTNEFIELCRRLGAEPYINVNFGSGTPREAADWVEYCNGAANTPAGRLRAKHGHPEPYRVKYWGVANEIWGIHETGFCINGAQYARRYLNFRKAMKNADPSISIVAVGANRLFPQWNKRFIEQSAGEAEYLSLHEYTPGVNPLGKTAYSGLPRTKQGYYDLISGAEMFKDSIIWFQKTITDAGGPDTKTKIAFDEWNAWWSYKQLLTGEDYTLRDGILTACALSSLIKLSPIVGMANFAQMVNCLGLINVCEESLFMTPSYYVMKLYRDHVYDEVLESEVECGTVRAMRSVLPPVRKPMPLIDALATMRKRADSMSLIVINKHFSEPVSALISFRGFKAMPTVSMRLISSDSPFDGNSAAEPEKVSVSETKKTMEKKLCRLTLPPHSITQITFKKFKNA